MRGNRLFIWGVGGLTAVFSIITLILFFGQTAVAAPQIQTGPKLVINEIDYDTPGTSDQAEFIEIKNIGNGAASLDLFSLDLVDGDGESASVYLTLDLPAFTLNPGEYFVVCRDMLQVRNCDWQPEFRLEDGTPDALALRRGGVITDSVSYEGDTPGYTEGSGVDLEDDGLGEMGISRFPDGVDSDVNNVDFSARCVTPGFPNTAVTTNCTQLFDPKMNVTLTAVTTTIPHPDTPVTFTMQVKNSGLVSITTDSFTHNGALDLNGRGTCHSSQILLGGDKYACHYQVLAGGNYSQTVTHTVLVTGHDDLSVVVTDTAESPLQILPHPPQFVYLPAVQLDWLAYGEPNDSCHEALPLWVNALYQFKAEDNEDWYLFDLVDAAVIRIELTNFVPQDGQIVVYTGPDCGNLTFVANEGSTAVNRTLNLGQQPAGHYLIWLINDGPLNNTDLYSLHIIQE
ncbi:MAG: lamin tail domain-containing protein [Chloroflexi bacterium]|nr:lamin tail domain-containing protein [Chloroflexota bacterium]